MPQQRGVVIQLKTELARDVPQILGVEGDIREALVNLIFNAVDAVPQGGTVTLRTAQVRIPSIPISQHGLTSKCRTPATAWMIFAKRNPAIETKRLDDFRLRLDLFWRR
jgi:hypothetical protein